jgi:hypothetical protein
VYKDNDKYNHSNPYTEYELDKLWDEVKDLSRNTGKVITVGTICIQKNVHTEEWEIQVMPFLKGSLYLEACYKSLFAKFEDIPLLMSYPDKIVAAVIKWRLSIGR